MDNIIKQVAEDLNLPEAVVEKILKSQFSFVKECMENKSNVHLAYLGKFVIKPGRVYKIKQNEEARKNRNISE
jgi:nucleoid DNA-binding protein